MGKLKVDLSRSMTMKQSLSDKGDTSLNSSVVIIRRCLVWGKDIYLFGYVHYFCVNFVFPKDVVLKCGRAQEEGGK